MMMFVGLVAFVLSGAGTLYHGLNREFNDLNVDEVLAEEERPPLDPFIGQAKNILLLGIDYRSDGDEFNSDTTMLIHVPENREWVEVVSIPRDSLVDIPACTRTGGTTTQAVNGMFNSAFLRGAGPERNLQTAVACTIATVEYNTNVRITDYVVVNMESVPEIVDTIGGINVNLPEAVIGNAKIDLNLPAGPQLLNGNQTINFLRARGGQGMGLEEGSDLRRIERQQFLLSALMTDLQSQNVFSNMPQLYNIGRSVISNTFMSQELQGLRNVVGFALSLSDINSDNLIFTRLPVTAAPQDPNRVVWVQPAASEIFNRIQKGEAPAEFLEKKLNEDVNDGINMSDDEAKDVLEASGE